LTNRRLPETLAHYDCRNNRLAQISLENDGLPNGCGRQRARYGRRRVGVFLGTSTAGILQTELAYRRRDPESGALPDDFIYRSTQNPFSLAEFTRDYFALEGPAMAVSTACSSSAKSLCRAARQIACGTIDAALVGGVDSLCLTTLYGFASLELTSSPSPCRPYDVARNGISVAEGAAFALLERPPAQPQHGRVRSCCSAVGESSDAYHMSAPHPQGLGARMAMAAALRSAGLKLRSTSTTSTCTAPRRRPMTPPKARRWPRCSASACHAVRPRVRPATRWAPPARRSGCLRAGADARPAARQPAYGSAGSGDSARLPGDCPLGSRAARTEQLLRLWRQQLQPRSRGGAMSPAPLTAWIEGIGFLAPGCRTGRWRAPCCAANDRTRQRPPCLPVPSILPSAERRRASRVVKLALALGLEAAANAEADVSTLATVFSRLRRRRPQLPRAVRAVGNRRSADFADPFPQLGP
jgi:hypothetical protein